MRLERKYEGPCLVLQKVGKASYKFNIPAWMKIHLVIHVSNLKSYYADPARNQPTKRVVKANQWSSRELEEILAEREVVLSRRRRMEYLMNWKNLGDDESTWETADNLKKLLQKIEDHDTRSSRRRQAKQGKVWCVATPV